MSPLPEHNHCKAAIWANVSLFVLLLMVFCFKEIQVFLFADGNGGQDMLSLLGQPEGHILWFFVCPADFL